MLAAIFNIIHIFIDLVGPLRLTYLVLDLFIMKYIDREQSLKPIK